MVVGKRTARATRYSRVVKKIKVEPEAENEVRRIDSDADFSGSQYLEEAKAKTENKTKSTHLKVEIEEQVSGKVSEHEQEILPPNIFPKVDRADEGTGPKGWSTIYNEVVEMRSKFVAPVDHQGCESMPNTITPNLQTQNPQKYRFQLLISLMLSSQTKDEVNYQTMVKLNNGLASSGGFCIETVSKLTPSEIDSYIASVGFHNRKSQYIAKTCQILLQKYKGDIPQTIEEIVELPGVGPKMGHLLLQCGWGINSGIGVDVHLHRLASMWKWISPKANTPEKCRIELESWLPKKYWMDINPLMVGFGQVVCVPRTPNCDVCNLGRKGICKSRNQKLLKMPMSEERRAKLMKQRADLTNLINLINDDVSYTLNK